MNTKYHKQVVLLLEVLPLVAKEKCFALHGGTAINLFYTNMPRLSVDIDLTYIPIQDRETSFTTINASLLIIKKSIEKVLFGAIVKQDKVALKLLITHNNASIKIEVSNLNRGLIAPVTEMELCKKAQSTFNAYCEIQVVSKAQLYGGKICAALDRQHPRDIFDLKDLLKSKSPFKSLKIGIIYAILSSSRPIHELLHPTLLNQETTFTTKFEGMTDTLYTYADFEKDRNRLVISLNKLFTKKEKQFILDIYSLQPNWADLNLSEFPSIQFKLLNLKKLHSNKAKFNEQINAVKLSLGLE